MKHSPLCTGHDHSMMSRRSFLNTFGYGLGGMALAGLSYEAAHAGALLGAGHLPAKAKRVIFLYQSGAPSQMDLFDYKPRLNQDHGKELPDSVRKGQRLTGMSAHQSSLPLVGSPFAFKQHGQCGAWVSDLMPHTAKVVDDLCFIRSMHTEAINHGPGVMMMQTGSQFPGRPSMGAWLGYGLGSETQDLPSYVVLVGSKRGGQPLTSNLWGSGFLPGKHDGVELRPDKDAVLYLNSPDGLDRASRRKALDRLNEWHALQLAKTSDPAIETRIAQYEMAFRMQTSVPDVVDIADESEATLKLYGDDVRTPGSYAANCLRARRLAEKGVRFIQVFQSDWDHHGFLPAQISKMSQMTDQATAALIQDLKSRGMLDDTLVVWGGEFGRTSYSQGKIEAGNFGRDHHPRCFTLWMAGGGVKGGTTYGETDEFSYNIVKDPVHIHDLHATMLHLLGVNHEQLTFKYQGRHFRLTDVHGKLVKDILT